jgi:chemotaxis protein methyltransferase CheR
VGDWESYYRVKKAVSRNIDFQQINLIEPYSHQQSFEIIFCRNVMIYFDRKTQAQLVHQLCQHLVPGGYLLVGHSESLNGLNVPVRCLRPSIYQRT